MLFRATILAFAGLASACVQQPTGALGGNPIGQPTLNQIVPVGKPFTITWNVSISQTHIITIFQPTTVLFYFLFIFFFFSLPKLTLCSRSQQRPALFLSCSFVGPLRMLSPLTASPSQSRIRVHSRGTPLPAWWQT